MLPSEHDSRELDALRDRFIAADRAGDAEAMGQLLTDDVVVLHPYCGVFEGRAAAVGFMRQVLAEVHDQFDKRSSYWRIELIVSDDLAIERGRFAQDLTAKDGGEPHRDEGMYLWVYLRSADKHWKLARIAGTLTSSGDEAENRAC